MYKYYYLTLKLTLTPTCLMIFKGNMLNAVIPSFLCFLISQKESVKCYVIFYVKPKYKRLPVNLIVDL